MTDRLRRRLLHRISRHYEIAQRDLSIGHLRLRFTQIKNPDRVLDDIVAEADRIERVSGRRQTDDELHLPYWAEVWDSALGLGEYLCCGDSQLTTGNSVLDLGCGMGLAGTVAAALGHRVMFADIESPALLFARLNSIVYREHVRTRRLDWQRDSLPERFDLILGADVLYDKEQWDNLEKFWRAHLRDRASVLLGEPGRQSGDLFVPWIVARGWKLEQSHHNVSTRDKPIRVLRVFR